MAKRLHGRKSGAGSIPGREIDSHVPQLKISPAATEK